MGPGSCVTAFAVLGFSVPTAWIIHTCQVVSTSTKKHQSQQVELVISVFGNLLADGEQLADYIYSCHSSRLAWKKVRLGGCRYVSAGTSRRVKTDTVSVLAIC
jgi:hypothetical protein